MNSFLKSWLALAISLSSLAAHAQAPFAWGQPGPASDGSQGAGTVSTPVQTPAMGMPAGAPRLSMPGGRDPSRDTLPPEAGDATSSRTVMQRPAAPPPPSQFQRFVFEATGRMLPHYGSELFRGPQPFAADPALPAPADYLLAVGDEVRVQIWGAVDYAASHVVDRNGQIHLPRIGVINLAGVAARDLDQVLRTQIGRVFSNVNVGASLGRLRAIPVYVVGQAQQPGTYQLPSLSTLVNAVFASGGPNPQGSMRNIQLRRGGQTVATLDLYDFIGKGDKGQDMPLRAGDVIVIPPAGPRVALNGALDQAAIYELKSGSQPLGDILSLGGGLPTLADPRRAVLERVTPQSSPARQVKNLTLNAEGLRQPLQDGDVLTILPISPAFANAVTLQGKVAQPLRYGWFQGMRVLDLIPDREALISPGYYARKNLLVQNITQAQQDQPSWLLGRGLRDGPDSQDPRLSRERDPRDGRDLRDLRDARDPRDRDLRDARDLRDPRDPREARELRERDTRDFRDGGRELRESRDGRDGRAGPSLVDRIANLADDINWDYAVIERLDPERLTTRIIPFNLGRAVLQKDPAHNLPLQPGDVVTILSDSDLRLPVGKRSRMVRVEGEVAAPGVYQAEPGETLPQLIQRIGGLTPHAYLFGTEFSREAVRQRQQENLDALLRRLESQSQAQATAQLSNIASDRAAQAQAIQQMQQAQLRSQIDRLKQVRSNGRVSLELDPRARSLAALPGIPLEDGDRIVIPASPGFVAAVGSVNNENVFIYRPGKTVGEVIRSAGLTEDAEPGQAFLLRADGSIVARRDRSNWLGSRFESMQLMPGDTVVIPAMLDRESRYNFVTRAVKDWTQILSNFGIGVAALRTLRD